MTINATNKMTFFVRVDSNFYFAVRPQDCSLCAKMHSSVSQLIDKNI